MIYTLTFNPSLDYIIYVENYREGGVNRADEERIVPGGKGINVSLVLKNLGAESTALGFVGGFVGDEIERLLTEQGINTDFIRIEGNSRINIKLKAEKETEINAKGPQIDKNEELYAKLSELQSGDYLVMAGSAPEKTAYADILKRLPCGVKAIIDAEGELLLNTLKYKPFLIKPNHHELGAMFGKEIKSASEAVECARELQMQGAQNVFVSMAGDGGLLVTEDGAWQCSAPEGDVINSTGAGDSAVAGFIAEYIERGNIERAFVSGICTGSASAFSHGFAVKEQVEELMEVTYVSRI